MDNFRVALLILVALVGTVGHTLTLFMLSSLKKMLNKSLDPTTRRLMASQAVVDLLFCGVGLPLCVWNMLVGNAWPFSYSGSCYYLILVYYNLINISVFHMVAIATLRLLAVFSSTKMTKKSPLVQATIIATPWILGNVVSFFGYMLSFYQFANDPRVNVCRVAPVDFRSPQSLMKMKIYFVVDGIVDTLVPVAIACGMYVIILTKLYARRSKTTPTTQHANGITIQVRPVNNPGNTGHAQPAASANQSHSAAPPSHNALAVVGSNTAAASAAVNNNISGLARSADRRFQAGKVIAFACFVNMVLVYPLTLVAYMGDIYLTLVKNYPLVFLLLVALYTSSFCITPLVYAASSQDMRTAYRKQFVVLITPLTMLFGFFKRKST